MEMFAKYLDSIGQKYEMQVLDSQGDNDKEVDNMRQFSAKAGGNAIAYSDPNENSIAYSLAEAMAESAASSAPPGISPTTSARKT
jgi:ribose transport system substrate-binding protein